MLQDLRLVSVAETFSRFVSFVTIPFLTNALVPAEYGIYRSVFVLVSLLLLMRGILNLSPLIQKRLPELPREERRNLIATTTLLFAILMGLIAMLIPVVTDFGLLAYVSADLQQFVVGSPFLVILLVVSMASYRFGLTLCQGLDSFTWFSWTKLLHETVFLFSIVGLFWVQRLTVETAVIAYLVAHVMGIGILAIPLHEELIAVPDWEEFTRSFQRISAPLIPRTLIKKAKTSLPDILIISSFGSAVFGAWSVLFAFVTVFQFYSQPFSQILLPKVSKRLADGQQLGGVVHRYYRLMLVLTVPAVVGGALIGDEIIRYVFGEGYLLNTAVIVVILAAFGLQTINTLAGPIFVATDRSIYATYLQTITAITLLTLIALGTYVFDSLLIVASGYLVENAVGLAIAIGYQRTVVDFSRPSPRTVAQVASALVVMAIVVSVLTGYVGSLMDVIGVTAMGAAVYFAILWGSGFFTEDDISLVNRFVGRGT